MIKNLIILIHLLLLINSFGQERMYFDNDWNKMTDSINAVYYKDIIHQPENRIIERVYFINGQIKSEIEFVLNSEEKKERDGKSSFWYESGELKNEIFFKNGKKEGLLLSFWKDGTIKRKDVYKNNKLKKGSCFNEKGEKIKYYKFEIMPEFPGGKRELTSFIKKNLRYPSISNQYKIGGKVILEFKVDKLGFIQNIIVKTGVNVEIDNEAIRIIKAMPRWKPGLQDGNPVSVKYRLPILFQPN